MIKHIAVAFYPEHLSEERWSRDIDLMRENGINCVRILEFAWSRMERDDGQWDFGWVHRVMKLLAKAGVDVVPCTPSAAPPVWMTRRHPQCLAMDAAGNRAAHGARRHYCPTSAVYRTYSNRIAAKMQEELARYDNVIAWQIDNEFGWNKCFCPECVAAFRKAVRSKYPTLESLNEAWGGAFWSVDYWDWDDLDLPRAGNALSPEMKLALRQFYSDQATSFMSEQVAALKAAGAKTPISTNMMGDFDDVDYWAMAKPLDVVGFDNYFDIYTLAGDSLAHNLIRSLKGGQGYWTFENGVNSVGPWLQPPPGYLITHALAAAAHGEIGHTFFRWDSCLFAHEQDLQGMVDWAGRPRAALGEVKELAGILKEIRKIKLPPIQPRIAFVYSWQNYWAAKDYFSGTPYSGYWSELEAFYQALFDFGLICDCVPPDGDLSPYDLVVTPALQMASDDELESFRRYVRDGGVLLTGRKTFCKTPSGSYRGCDHPALDDVFGLRVAESQSPQDCNDITIRAFAGVTVPQKSFHLSGTGPLPASQTQGWFEVLEPKKAKSLYSYSDGYFPGRPAACRNRFGKGHAFYLGARIDRAAMKEFVRLALDAAGIDGLVDVPQGVQLVRRGDVCFITNHTTQEQAVPLPGPGKTLAGQVPDGRTVLLPGLGYAVVRVRK